MIVEALKTLPPPKLGQVSDYIHRLKESDRSERLKILQETSGIWSSEEADAVEKAIEEGCENIDANGKSGNQKTEI